MRGEAGTKSTKSSERKESERSERGRACQEGRAWAVCGFGPPPLQNQEERALRIQSPQPPRPGPRATPRPSPLPPTLPPHPHSAVRPHTKPSSLPAFLRPAHRPGTPAHIVLSTSAGRASRVSRLSTPHWGWHAPRLPLPLPRVFCFVGGRGRSVGVWARTAPLSGPGAHLPSEPGKWHHPPAPWVALAFDKYTSAALQM